MSLTQTPHNLFHPLVRDSANDAVAAIIVLENGRYLMQLRDDKPGIFYPGHWGLFGGAVEKGENFEDALFRELNEELSYQFNALKYFTKMNFCFENLDAKKVTRVFYEVQINSDLINQFQLGEGQALKAMTAEEILFQNRVVPYDSFAIWMHYTRSMKQQNQ